MSGERQRQEWIAALLAFGLALGGVGCDSSTLPQQPTIDVNGRLPEVLNKVVKLIGRGRHAEARQAATGYVKAHPADARGPFMLGWSYHKAGNHGKARGYFEDALRLSADYVPTRHFYGECLFMLGDLDGAEAQYRAHLAADAGEPDARYGLGIVALERSQLDVAASEFKAAITLYAQLGKTHPRKLEARRSSLAECHARIGDVFFARGEYAAARDALLESTRLEPRNISAFYTLSLVYRRLGDATKATQALQRYDSAKQQLLRRGEG